MNFIRFGFIDFFGILAPGVIFLVNMIILIYALLGLTDTGMIILKTIQTSNMLKTFLDMSGAGITISLILLIICYLFGFILRLVRPDLVDIIAGYYLKIIAPRERIYKKYTLMLELEKKGELNKLKDDLKQKKISLRKRYMQFNNYLQDKYYADIIKNNLELPRFFWAEEKYPYYYGIKNKYFRNLPKELSERIMDEKKFHNGDNYNYWKTLLAARDQNLSSLVFQAEAYVRFMCGAFWALLVGLIAGIILCINNSINYQQVNDLSIAFGLFFAAVSLLMMIILLTRYKNQRRREVKILLDGIIITSQGKNGLNFYLPAKE